MTAPLRRTRAALAAMTALAALSVSACANYSTTTPGASGSAAASGATVPLVQPGKLLVCTHLSYKPFQYREGSKVVGFDVDIMDLVAKKLNVTQEIVDIEFAQITSGAVFAAKKCDAGAAAVTVTDKRKEAVLFSDPYFKATQALITKDSSVTDLASLKGKKLGVQSDTTGLEYAEKNKAQYGYEIVVFDDMPSELAAVLAGTVAAGINDNGVVYDYAKENPTMKVVKEFDTGEVYGMLFDKNNQALAKLTNDALTQAKSDGTYATIYKKWFNAEPPK